MRNEEFLAVARKTLFDWLSLHDEPTEAAAIFVLGADRLEPVKRAVALFKAGYAPYIAFISIGGTYGGKKVFGMPEHEKYRKVLLESGIPESAILSEGLSTNTLEEAQRALPFLKKKGAKVDRMILCSRPVHQRRAWATFQKQNASTKFINCPAFEIFDTTDESLSARMIQEVERLEKYARQGDLVEQTFSPEVLKAIETIRRG